MSAALFRALCERWQTGASGEAYALGGDSLPQPGVRQGQVLARTWNDSRIYPDATHEYWVYVPAQYTSAEPACVMVFQDGKGYAAAEGSVRAPTVFDNLIHKAEMPVTIGVFVNPGKKEQVYDQRKAQYVPLDDKYARFLLEEILPQVGKDYNLVDDRAGRAICGMSDGGLCAFTVGWERPDAFSKVVSHIGSFTRLRGGSEYPYLIRKTRGDPKPLRVFLQDGADDLDITEGSWTIANLNMASALMFARYDCRFELGPGGHDLRHGGAIFPDTLRWLWRDHPGVKGAAARPSLAAVVGRWNVVTHFHGEAHRSVLTIAEQDGALAATLDDDKAGRLEVTAIAFADGILSYEYFAPPSQALWSKGRAGAMKTWLRVEGDAFAGALGNDADHLYQVDFPVEGARTR